ncbi:MAG: peptide deformylase [Deinococcota bacterium]
MAIRDILLLGNPTLYDVCDEVTEDELASLAPVVTDLHDTMMAFRQKWGAGRAIAAPQIGVMKRLVYMHIDAPVVFINPYFDNQGEAVMDVWDDCMSFPELLVKVRRHARCDIVYRDTNWREQRLSLEGDLSELLQHEVDHLDGVLAVSRALGPDAFALRSQQHFTDYDRSNLPQAK